MPLRRMRAVVKVEDDGRGGGASGEAAGVGVGLELQAAKRREKEEDVRRLRWGGAVVPDEALLLRECALCGQSQAQMIRAMEQTRVIGEELLQAKAEVARLQAEANISAEAYRSKEVLLQSIIRSKDELLVMKNELLNSKKSAPKAHDALAADAPKKVCDGSLFPMPFLIFMMSILR